MTKHLRFLFVMLLAMIWSAGWAQTTIWSEDWSGRKADTQPKDIMYDNVVYGNTSDNTKIYNEERAGGPHQSFYFMLEKILRILGQLQ